MPKLGIFIDGANIFYGLKDRRMDFTDFKKWIADGREVEVACYFNASQKDREDQQAFFSHVKKSGFRVFVKRTTLNSATGEYKQAGIDVYLAVKAMKFINLFDTFILVAGDYDYTPLINEMQYKKKSIEIVSFEYCLHPIYKQFKVRYIDDYLKGK